MLELNTKVNSDDIVSSCWWLTFYLLVFLEKSVNYSVNLFSNQNINSANASIAVLCKLTDISQ